MKQTNSIVSILYGDAPSSLMTVDEVATLLRVQPETVRRMSREGRIPCRKVGKSWRFDGESIRKWVRGEADATHLAARESATVLSSSDIVSELALPLYEVPPLHQAPPQRANGTNFKDPSFTENRDEPVHRWVPWVAGFSSGFVADCLNEYIGTTKPEDKVVLDPFAGVGTTLVEAYKHGHSAIGLEINPWAALAARAKLEAIDVPIKALETWIKLYRVFMEDTAGAGDIPDPSIAPAGFRSRIPFFSPNVQSQVLWTLNFITHTGDQTLRDLLMVAFGSVMVKFSNYSYEPSLGSRPGSGKPLIENADVCAIVSNKLAEILYDCRFLQQQVKDSPTGLRREIIQDSVFNGVERLGEEIADLCITSPPYLNNYHYIRNTRPHLFWLKFLETTADLKQIEHASFGKYWQTVRDNEPIHLSFANAEIEQKLDHIRALNSDKGIYGGSGWANYAAQYFNDTHKLCGVLYRLMKPGSFVVLVVGNSILQGVELRVDEYYAQIAEAAGFRREAIHMLRSKRVGNSIINSSVRNGAGERTSLYEVSVVLRKPSK